MGSGNGRKPDPPPEPKKNPCGACGKEKSEHTLNELAQCQGKLN